MWTAYRLALRVILAPTWLFAQSGSTGTDWIDTLLKGGPFAIVLLLIIADRITTPGERNRLLLENQELREEVKQLNQSFQKEVMPPLIEISKLMPQMIEALAKPRRGSQ